MHWIDFLYVGGEILGFREQQTKNSEISIRLMQKTF